MIAEFIRYVSLRDPSFPGRIAGASDQEIDTLERLASRRLPDSYKEFLSFMGHNDADLRLAWDCTTDISAISSYYKEEVHRGEEIVPSNCIVVGLGGTIVEEISLRLDGGGEPTVVISGGGEVEALYAESLPKLLYRRAFAKYNWTTSPHRAAYVNAIRAKQLLQAERRASEMGFHTCWFSDAIAYCGEQEGASVTITQFEGDGLVVQIAARNESELSRMGQIFASRLGLNRQASQTTTS
jgi:hypothetical protein